MKTNGVTITLDKPILLCDFLESQNYDVTKIAVEHNGQIVPRSTYKNVILIDDDRLEIVKFVGGG